MSKTKWEHREISPTGSPDLDGDGARLFNLLNLLVTALERLRADDPLPGACRGPVSERWEDEGYVYLESDLPSVLGSEMDISIHRDRVFIRIER